jgi:hypothetical protein
MSVAYICFRLGDLEDVLSQFYSQSELLHVSSSVGIPRSCQ